jgi:NADH-quinone oxidoreductase subunit F
MLIKTMDDLRRIKQDYTEILGKYKYLAYICGGTGCVSANCGAVEDALRAELQARGMTDDVAVIKRGCMGTCAVGPVVYVHPDRTYYTEMTPERMREVVRSHFIDGKVVTEYTFYDYIQRKHVPVIDDISFFKKQVRIALRNCGYIDVETIDSYIANDGYFALHDVLMNKSRQELIDIIKASGLRGRGGAGFPTGVKWQAGCDAPEGQKYIICNADEGDPGAFMDRSVFEGDPHSVLEGMLLGGYAIGAGKGYVYIRAEYPIALMRLREAIQQAKDAGILGRRIFGTDFDFDIEIRIGAGAFVCGEETALMESVEGKRGEPRQKPPFPFQQGLFGKPSIINNVETLANIPAIVLNGAAWFRQYGTEKSPGTKVFALTGHINNTGLVEVPMGIPLGDIVFSIGAGIPKEKKYKSAQTGGPSGGCITLDNLNIPMDYEHLAEAGSIMGSGGLIIMNEDTCMVDTARYFMDFIKEESCGKCNACRTGTTRMLEILERITRGEGSEEDIGLLVELGETIKDTAMCGLGQTAPNPILSTIKYFRDEYEEHIKNKYCRAGVCSELFISPCENTCPANINVPGYLRLIVAGRFIDAYNLIRQENPFPAVCGRICTHPCEAKCRRGSIDEAVAIRELKRYAADYAYKNEQPFTSDIVFPKNGKRVAIIGAGSSGLTCGYYLVRIGYDVDVYESESVAGGVLAFGIPEYRLPKKVLQHEIDLIVQAGVNLHLNIDVDKDMTFKSLRARYDAVYVATGAQFPEKVNIPGENLPGVIHGIDFLKSVNLGKEIRIGHTVAVIGGGNTAIDSARTALRMGAKKVMVLYRRTRDAMPAYIEEVNDAVEEGIEIMDLISPVRLVGGKNGRIAKIECVRNKLGGFSTDGRRKAGPIEGSNFFIDVDTVIPAVSQHSDLPFIPKSEIGITPWGTFIIDNDTMMTTMPGVFAGGDVARGPDTVIQAIADGKKAAVAIDKYLGGTGKLNKGASIDIPDSISEDEVVEHPRFGLESLAPDKRKACFDEVDLGYHKLNAMAEAMRCLHCDRR